MAKMVKIVIFDEATGEILRVVAGNGFNIQAGNVHPGERLIYVDPNDDIKDTMMFVNITTGDLKKRPTLLLEESYQILANGVDEVSINVPVGTHVSSDHHSDMIDDGIFEFATDIPGEYLFSLSPPFPNKPMEIIINAF